MSTETLKERVEEIYDETLRAAGERDGYIKQLDEVKASRIEKDQEISDLQAVTDVFEVLVRRQEKENAEAISAFVSEGLKKVYQDDSYMFRIDLPIKRGRPEAHFSVGHVRGGREVWAEVKSGHGTGLAELVGLLLQATVVVGTEEVADVLIMDDPVAHLPPEMAERAGEVINEISSEVQSLYTTTQPALAATAQRLYKMGWLETGTAGLSD